MGTIASLPTSNSAPDISSPTVLGDVVIPIARDPRSLPAFASFDTDPDLDPQLDALYEGGGASGRAAAPRSGGRSARSGRRSRPGSMDFDAAGNAAELTGLDETTRI